jgi:hypothetical protein
VRKGPFSRWYTFASAPQRWWIERARAEADEARRDVTTVLGRPPVDEFETIDVLLNRHDEVVTAMLKEMARRLKMPELAIEDETDEDGDPPPRTWQPGTDFCALVEKALLERGWRLEHPVLRGVLIGPDGQRLDVRSTVTPDPPRWNLDGLRALLRPAGVEGQLRHAEGSPT